MSYQYCKVTSYGYVGNAFYDPATQKYYKSSFSTGGRFKDDIVSYEQEVPTDKEISNLSADILMATYSAETQHITPNVTIETLGDDGVKYLTGLSYAVFQSTALESFSNI